MKQKRIFKKTLEWLTDRINNGTFDNTSANIIEEAVGVFKRELSQDFQSKNLYKKFYNELKKDYVSWKDKAHKEHKGITKKSIKDFTPKARKELENRIKNSFLLIKNKDDEIKAKLASKFINYITIDTKEIRGNGASEKSLLDFLDFAKENKILEEHARFILRDQSRKLNASLNFALADLNNCVGAFWHTMHDKRVVGNPNGLYPKGNSMHNDHYKRDGKFFVFKNSWAYKNGYVKGEIYDNLEDGGVGVAINCRCNLGFVYSMVDVPKENLTDKGLKYVRD